MASLTGIQALPSCEPADFGTVGDRVYYLRHDGAEKLGSAAEYLSFPLLHFELPRAAAEAYQGQITTRFSRAVWEEVIERANAAKGRASAAHSMTS
jgi:hypothetical protein